jgi:hypothetical protein
MKRRTLILAGGLVVLLAAPLTWNLVIQSNDDLPQHEGKKLDYWFEQLPCAHVRWVAGQTRVISITPTANSHGYIYGSTIEQPWDAIRAIESMGTNAIPFLMEKLQQPDSRMVIALQKSGFRLGLDTPLFPDNHVARAQAMTGLLALEPLPGIWRDVLEKLSKSDSGRVAGAAKAVISGGGLEGLIKTNLVGDL